MIKIYIPERFIDLHDDSLINEVLNRLDIEHGNSEKIIEQRNGRYIKIVSLKQTFYVTIASQTANARNAYIMQYLAPAYSAYVKDISENKKLCVFYPFHFTGDQTIARYHLFTNRLIKTIGGHILNEVDAFNRQVVEGFKSFEEFQHARDEQRSGSSNSSSYVTRDISGRIEIFGKTYGANMQETVILVASVVKLVQNTPIYLFPVVDHETTTHTSGSLEIFKMLGVEVQEPLQENISTKAEILSEVRASGVRNTGRFHYNLLKKFGPKNCHMCSCEIDTAIIGAHIHRVTDIKNDNALTLEEKLLQASHADNGLWLCATHDKLYEYGLVFYDEFFEVQVSNKLSFEQKQYVQNLTTKKTFNKEHQNEATQYYLKKHRERIGC